MSLNVNCDEVAWIYSFFMFCFVLFRPTNNSGFPIFLYINSVKVRGAIYSGFS